MRYKLAQVAIEIVQHYSGSIFIHLSIFRSTALHAKMIIVYVKQAFSVVLQEMALTCTIWY